MKQYEKPLIISEQVFERVAISCDDYIYYCKEYEGCIDEYLGRGKIDTTCADLWT